MTITKLTPRLLREQTGTKEKEIAKALSYSILEYRHIENHPEELTLIDVAIMCQFYKLDTADGRMLVSTIMNEGLLAIA